MYIQTSWGSIEGTPQGSNVPQTDPRTTLGKQRLGESGHVADKGRAAIGDKSITQLFDAVGPAEWE